MTAPPPFGPLSSVSESQAPNPGPRVGSHPKDLGKKAKKGGWDPKFTKWASALYRIWGVFLCLGNSTQHPLTSEKREGQADPKRSVSQETRPKQNIGHQQLGNEGVQGQGLAVLGLERKDWLTPSPIARPGRQSDRSTRD